MWHAQSLVVNKSWNTLYACEDRKKDSRASIANFVFPSSGIQRDRLSTRIPRFSSFSPLLSHPSLFRTVFVICDRLSNSFFSCFCRLFVVFSISFLFSLSFFFFFFFFLLSAKQRIQVTSSARARVRLETKRKEHTGKLSPNGAEKQKKERSISPARPAKFGTC